MKRFLFISTLAVLGISTEASADLRLTNVFIFNTDSSSNYVGSGFDASTAGGAWDLNILDNSGTPVFSSSSPLDVDITTPGTYNFFYRTSNSWTWPSSHGGIELAFNNQPLNFGSNPSGIGGRVEYDSSSPSLSLFGSDPLTHIIGSSQVTLTGFTILSPSNPTTLPSANGSDSFGQFTLQVAVATTPVPEPENYAMLIMGLGLVGFMGKRRNKKLS